MHSFARASLACLPCRSSKSKCGGVIPTAIASTSTENTSIVPAEFPCTRCERLNLFCQWRPAHRTGRPSRKIGLESGPSSDTTSSSLQYSGPSEPPTSSSGMDLVFDQSIFELCANSLSEGQGGSMSPDSLFTFLEEDTGGTHLTANSVSLPFEPCSADAASLSGSMKIVNQLEQFKVKIGQTSLAKVSPKTQQTNDTELGVHRYFASLGRSSPLLGLKSDFMARIHSCEKILIEAISALGHLFFEGCESSNYGQARQESLRLAHFEPIGGVQSILDYCIALILIVYTEYGANNIEVADTNLSKAYQMALRYGLNLLDAPTYDNSRPLSFLAQMCQSQDDLMETGRRVWWELFVADALLNLATSGNILRRFDFLNGTVVHIPRIADLKDREAYQMRIQAITLMVEILGPQITPLDSLDSILSNLTSSVQDRWLSYTSRLTDEAEKNKPGIHVAQSVLFQTLLMLHAARIHLHRQVWFSEMSLDYETCSFRTTSITASTLESAHEKSGSASQSADQIISCSSSILRLMQLDSELHFRRAESNRLSDLPLISPHWPFIGCCQMVASYGFAMATILSEQVSFQDPITSKGSTARMWRRREDVSKLGFAEATLGNLVQVWKVAEVYRTQVHQCRIAVEQSQCSLSSTRMTLA